jgi:hypothetical protein
VEWARRSAQHADRAASAAERSADVQQRALELDESRAAREDTQRAEERAPRWEAVALDETGWFKLTGGAFEGALVNAGLSSASIELAVLDTPDGQRHQLQLRREPPGPASGGWESSPIIPPGSLLSIRCEGATPGLLTHGRPQLYFDYEAVGVMRTGLLGATVQLLRQSVDAAGAVRWKVGEIQYMVRA